MMSTMNRAVRYLRKCWDRKTRANSVDYPHQKPEYEVSDQGLHCLPHPALFSNINK